MDVFFTDTESESLSPNQPDVTKLLKKDIECLIAQQSDRITFVEVKLKSPVWKRFQQAKVDDTLVNFVACVTCSVVYIWTSTSGTTSLKRHKCEQGSKKRGARKPVSATLLQYSRKTVPQAGIAALNKSITFGLAKDMKSLNSVEGKGFLHMAQSFMNFGAKYGCQQAENVIQHRTTLRNNYVPELCEDGQRDLKTFFQTAPPNHKFAFSKDMWTDKYKQRSFLSMTNHYIDDNWVLHSSTLGLDEVDESKTTENIRERCAKMLGLYFEENRVLDLIENSFAVTDGGSNMLKVFRKQLPCQCHKINLFVDWTLSDRQLPKDDDIEKRAKAGNPFKPQRLFKLSTQCPSIKKTLTTVKSIVTYFKQTTLNSKLSHTLKQVVTTRWDSELTLLESYVKVKPQVEDLLLQRRQFDKLSGVNHDILHELINFLEPIRKCSKALSGDKYPTIHLVALSFSLLQTEIEIKDTDSDEMKVLKRNSENCFKEYLVITDFLLVACMLDPNYRELNFIEQRRRDDAIVLFKKMVDEQRMEQSDAEPSASSKPSTSTATAVPKKSCRFERFKDIATPQSIDGNCEVEKYLSYQKFNLDEYTDENGFFDVLRFWKDMDEFPNVKKVARCVLAIPAAETSDERAFSDAGQILSPRRTLMDAETLCELVFIHKSCHGPKI